MGKQLFNYRAKHIHIEGFGEARAHVVALRDFGQLGPTRDKHNRNVPEARTGSALLEHGRAVHLRHVHVEKQDIWRVHARGLQCGGAVFGFNNIESLAAEKLGHRTTSSASSSATTILRFKRVPPDARSSLRKARNVPVSGHAQVCRSAERLPTIGRCRNADEHSCAGPRTCRDRSWTTRGSMRCKSV
jgi:hypothetical protein